MKKASYRYFPLLIAMVFTILGINHILQYRTFHTTELEQQKLQHDVQNADRITDHQEAVAFYRKIHPELPQIQLRALHRQWLIALETLHEFQLARANKILKKDLPVIIEKLQDHLDGMREGCSALLSDKNPLPSGATWRAYNLRGCIKLLKAYLVLETEGNWKKTNGMMKQAISDFKSAITDVDAINTSKFKRNLPRWNLELLTGERIVKMVVLTTIETERRLELKENLEAIIPEKGGYAPGEPIQRRIRK